MGLFHSKFKGNLYYPGTSQEEHNVVLLFLNGLSKIPIFAHHPTCQYHSNHLIKIGDINFCLGCFFMYSGIITGSLILYLSGASTITPWEIFLMGFLFFPPTIIQIFYQKYLFKAFSRFLLGIAISLFISSIIFSLVISNNILIAILLSLTFLLIIKFYSKVKKKKFRYALYLLRQRRIPSL
jgi:hypothetical protein